MIKPTEKELRAIVNLEGNPNFAIIKDWVNQSMVKQAFELPRIENDTACRMAQGRVQELQLLKGSFDMARDALATLKAQQEKKNP